MPAPTLASLLIQENSADILAAGLAIAQAIGLPTTSWLAGDPTRSLLMLEADRLAALETEAVGFISSGFLDYATPGWLAILAKQVFNVDVPAATFATTSVTLTNSLGGLYTINAGDVTVKNSSTGTTYHNTNTTPATLTGPGGTVTLSFVADVAGSAGSAGAAQIDTMVTNLLGVTCSNATAAIGLDTQASSTTIAQCRNKLGSFSPNGPASAYSYVALNPTLTGINTITKARAYPVSAIGQVLLYVASAGGPAAPGDVAAVQAAVLQWATPLTITPTTASATAHAINVAYTLSLYATVNQTNAQIQAAVQTALQNLFASKPIGGDILPGATVGYIYLEQVEAAIAAVYPSAFFNVSASLSGAVASGPHAGDVIMSASDVASLGTIAPTIVVIPNPS
jgi:hypothetical protein